MNGSSLNKINSLRLWLRDGVDVYIAPDCDVHFVFLSTRKRLRLKITPSLIESLEWFSGSATVTELNARYEVCSSALEGDTKSSFLDFTLYLYEKGILIDKDWMSKSFRQEEVDRFSRQLNFFLDIQGSTEAAINLLKKIQSTRIALIGVGAVGSWILKQLVQIGFQKFVLVDPNLLAPNDISRNAFFETNLVGMAKVDIANQFICKQALYHETRIEKQALNFDTEIRSLIGPNVDLIINTGDEPYIGATSIKLSRYCIKNDLPLLVAGGFDAHLASLSELVIPGQTPCSDCYALYFKNALSGWKPTAHPIVNKSRGFGGLPTLSVFAASSAVLKIMRLLSSSSIDVEHGRGEFLFDKYQIINFAVERNLNCPTCGQIESSVQNVT